jgi:ribosomal protein L3 glutamine methyltransferase
MQVLMMQNASPRAELTELATLRDVLRYAVSAFSAAELHYGHGSSTALDEAVFLILESLHLPVDDFNAFADARLTAREKALLGERIALRIEQRVPAAYLTGRSYLAGVPFASDARALVPRSFIGELLTTPLFNGSGEGMALIEDPHAVHVVLDLCTGGGSLAVLAAYAFPEADIDAVDPVAACARIGKAECRGAWAGAPHPPAGGRSLRAAAGANL